MENLIHWKRLIFIFVGLLGVALIVAPASAVAEPSPEETLAWCESLAIEAYEMASEAQVTNDYPTANLALNLASEASCLVTRVSRLAQDAADLQLAWSAYTVCNQVQAAIANIVRAARHIDAHSPVSEDAHAANVLLDFCEAAKISNKAAMGIALSSFRHSR